MKIEKAIVNSLKSIGMPDNITPILADRGGVEPEDPYLLINIINTNNIGLPRRTVYHKKGGEAVESLFQVKDYKVSFTFHAKANDEVHDWVHHFHTGLTSDMYDYAFSQQGLGLAEVDSIVYQPQPVNEVNYKRAIIDVTLRAEVLDEYFVNPLNSSEVVGDLLDSHKNKIDEVIVHTKY